MADENSAKDPYAVVLADLRVRREEIDRLIRGLESVRGTGSNVGGSTELETPAGESAAASAGLFLGMSIAEAAKRFLAARRRTLSSAEIASGLQAGGLAMNSSDPANTVSSVLIRRFASVGDIVRVSRGQWGLAEWYPNRSFRKKERESGGKKAETDPAKADFELELASATADQ
jgi:hypothetical protein